MKKVIETPIQKRFADIDVFRHVNNVHQQEYLDLGKEDYYHRVLGLEALTDSPTLVIVSVKNDFSEQIRYDNDIFVRTRVEGIGTKSVTLRQQIVLRGDADHEEKVCTESETVMVVFDRNTQQTLEFPDEWRAKITL